MNRSDEPLFDARIADWLEEDPHRAPDQTLQVVLAAFPSLKQRRALRVPWRFTMPTTAKALAVGVTALLIVIGGAWFLGTRQPNIAAPSPTPEPRGSASPPSTVPPSGPAMASVESPLYGYSVEAPAAYQFVPATEEWPAGEAVGPETEWTDRFRAATNFVGIASQPVPDRTSPDAWLDAYLRTVESRECGTPASTWTSTTIGTASGRTAAFDCGGDAVAEYAWVVDGRGWVVSGEAGVVELMMPTLSIP